jgi:hypothetical protein
MSFFFFKCINQFALIDMYSSEMSVTQYTTHARLGPSCSPSNPLLSHRYWLYPAARGQHVCRCVTQQPCVTIPPSSMSLHQNNTATFPSALSFPQPRRYTQLRTHNRPTLQVGTRRIDQSRSVNRMRLPHRRTDERLVSLPLDPRGSSAAGIGHGYGYGMRGHKCMPER